MRPSYASRMAQPSSSLEQLYRDLHQVDAEILAARPGRIGSRWMARRVADSRRLRLEINGAVKRRATPRKELP
jgi:hypothetical protein